LYRYTECARLMKKLNDDNALTRFEFVEIIVRVADAKYLKEKICDSLVEAITVMFEVGLLTVCP
jgi:hypothetical protein